MKIPPAAILNLERHKRMQRNVNPVFSYNKMGNYESMSSSSDVMHDSSVVTRKIERKQDERKLGKKLTSSRNRKLRQAPLEHHKNSNDFNFSSERKAHTESDSESDSKEDSETDNDVRDDSVSSAHEHTKLSSGLLAEEHIPDFDGFAMEPIDFY